MPLSARERAAYRADERENHSLMTEEERQRIFNARLPALNDQPGATALASTSQRRSRLGVRRFIRTQIHVFVFAILHGVFSLYIRVRQMWHAISYHIFSILYYHHGTPDYIRRDVMGLRKKPQHLSIILRAEQSRRAKGDLDRLIDETAEIATWCACAGIPLLSVYENTGILKKHMPRVYEATIQKFAFYFGGQYPKLAVTSPHMDAHTSQTPNDISAVQLELHLISSQDGRDSLVDLTRTLAEMSQKGKLSPRDISTELVDAELSEGIMSEPDLLIVLSPHVELYGYPPWQIRLTEIFCLQDNESFGYQVFLKALRRYSDAQFRRGK